MDWPLYDRNTWGLIFSVAALVLAFPLSLLANLLTPKLRNWWAERSVKTLSARINQLEWELMDAERFPMMTEVEDRLFAALFGIVTLIGVGFLFGLLAIGMLFTELNPSLAWSSILIVSIAAAVAMIAQVTFFGGSFKFVKKRSPKWRKMLEEQIEELKGKLGRKKS